MASNESSEKRGFSPDFAIESILKTFTGIKARDIELFAPVYYPIADIEIDFEENSFEDFEAVQITILKLLSIGHKSMEFIATLTGLTPSYVTKITNLLLSFGHIDSNLNLTPLGIESVRQGKKITSVRGSQKFQLDALGLNLIRLDKTVTRKSIVNKDELARGVMILDFPDSIETSRIVGGLQNDDFKRVMAAKNKLLNVNITKIHGIKCLGIRYVHAYFLKPYNHDSLIFCEREDFSKSGKKKFSWLPFAITDKSFLPMLGIDDLPLYPEDAVKNLKTATDAFSQEITSEKSRESMENAIDAIAFKEGYGFLQEGIRCDYTRGEIEILTKVALTKFNSKTLYLLKNLADNGVLLSTNKNLRGGLIKVFTRNEEILSALGKLNDILKTQGSDDDSTNVKIFIKKVEGIINNTEVNIIDIINNYQ